MSLAITAFENTSQRFRNVAKLSVREVLIKNPVVGDILGIINRLFVLLDHGDTFQAGLSSALWDFRSRILFTLLPFNSPELGLADRLQIFSDRASLVPGTVATARDLSVAIQLLLNHPENLKYEWIQAAMATARSVPVPEQIGIFGMMAMGRSFGWPVTDHGAIALPGEVTVIGSRHTLTSTLFDRVIVPGTCRYLSSPTFTELFYMGRTDSVDVLLYPGERFNLRQRLQPPECSIFHGRLIPDVIEQSRERLVDENPVKLGDDDQLRDDLWVFAHVGQRTPSPGLHEGRYILFTNSRGMFVPVGGRLLLWEKGETHESGTLESIGIDMLAEGDWLVFLRGNMGRLLDVESAADEFDQKVEDSCPWRSALTRLLITVSTDEIAEQMRTNGGHGVALSHSLANWATGTIYGPGCRKNLQALLQVLIAHNKLEGTVNFERYAAAQWRSLQELRAIRHRAGVSLRHKLHLELASMLCRLNSLKDGQAIDLQNGLQAVVRQIAAVDDRSSWVHPPRIGHFDDIGDIQWPE